MPCVLEGSKDFLVLLRVNSLSWVLGVIPEGGIEGDEELKNEGEDEKEKKTERKAIMEGERGG